MKYLLLLPAILLFSFKCGSAIKTPVQTVQKKDISSFFSEKDFNNLFPLRDKFYTYQAFMQAVKQMSAIRLKVEKREVSIYKVTRTDKKTGKAVVVRQDEDWNEPWAQKRAYSFVEINYGDFCNGKDILTNKKELAAFFANVAHETRHGENGKYNDGLMYTHEVNTNAVYISDNDAYPPVKGKNYYGRGPLQLSYNGNYGYASDCIFGNKTILLNNPELVSTNAVVAFEAAIFFWMTPVTYKPSAHDVMVGNWKPNAEDIAKNRTPGFGMTINIINGEIECNHGSDLFNMTDRIGFYKHFLPMLGASDDNCACNCGKMHPYN